MRIIQCVLGSSPLWLYVPISPLQESACNGQGVPANSVQLLLLEIQKEREKDPGLFVDVGLKPNNEMEYLLFQTSSMRSTLRKFPEHMILDATYCVNDISYPLVTFMCVDGNNESRVAGFALVPSESMAVYEKLVFCVSFYLIFLLLYLHTSFFSMYFM
jgi:hypothetical protein